MPRRILASVICTATKISLVGAGSASFGLETLHDIARSAELKGSTVALIDIDQEKLTIMRKVADRLNRHFRSSIKIETSTEGEKVLDGTEFVIVSAEKERMKRWRMDFAIPFKHGIRQVIGECGGPGGLAHTLRVVPLILDICREVEDRCKDALVLNYTNPEARVTLAIRRYSRLKGYGLCPGIYERLEAFAKLFGVKVEEFEPFAAGLNHFTWLLDLRFKDGTDAYPRLEEKLREKPDFEPLCRELYKAFHHYPSPSDNHCGEYVGYAWEKVPRNLRGTNWIGMMEKWGESVQKLALSIAEGEYPVESLPRREVSLAVRIINAMVENRRHYEHAVNMPNEGYVNNLPESIVVEVPAVVDKSGIRGVGVGSLPKAIANLCNTQGTIQELAVEAAFEGSYDKALQALLIDPAIQNLDAAKAVLDELLKAHAPLLPQFNR